MKENIQNFLLVFYEFIDPWGMLLLCFLLSITLLLSTFIGIAETDSSGIKIASIYLKNALIKLILITLILTPIFIISTAYSVGFMPKYGQAITHKISSFLSEFWHGMIFLILFPITIQAIYLRTTKPHLSRFFRRFRTKQTGESLSDVRTVIDNHEPKDFNPKNSYKTEHFFLGLDGKNNPIYCSDEEFKTTHTKIIGPSQTGKGVGLGTLIDQSIRKNLCTIFIDVKPDDFIYDIMRETCEEVGRKPPIIIDLNGIGIGRYAPFFYGTKRDRRSRLIKAMDLNEDGTNADHYRRNARTVFDFVDEYWNGTIEQLHALLHGKDELENLNEQKKNWIYENSSNIRSKITEWKNHQPLNPKPGRGLNLSETINNNRVIYIRSHTKDRLVREATITLIEELSQIALARNTTQDNHHIFCAIDEVRFLISESLADGLATLLSKGLNMALSYQSINDLLNIPDQRANAKSIKSGVETNTNRSIYYRANDPETAEWVSNYSGTVMKAVTHSENVKVNAMGAEEWDETRTLRRTEEDHIHINLMQNLPKRVGVLFQPGQIATVIYTCWIPIKNRLGIPLKGNKTQFPNRKKPFKEQQKTSIETSSFETGTDRDKAEADKLFQEMMTKDQPKSKSHKAISDVTDIEGL